MIAVIFDNICSKEILKEINKYRIVVFINTKSHATKLYSYIKKKVSGLEIKINSNDLNLLEQLAVNIAKTFAKSNKEPIHLYIQDKCIVY